MNAAMLLAVLFITMVLPVGSAKAQEARERRAGAKLSRDLCSGCHIVSETQRGPALDGVPSFPERARAKRTNAQLRA